LDEACGQNEISLLYFAYGKTTKPTPLDKEQPPHEVFHPKRLEIRTDKSIFNKHLAQLTPDFLFKYLITASFILS